MSLSQSMSMRMDQRQVLTPRMIQSMEILQLPLGALEERIDQELQINPVLEMRTRDREATVDRSDASLMSQDRSEGERALVVDAGDGAADFSRLERIADYFENEDFGASSGGFRKSHWDGQDRDGKMDAMANHAARNATIGEHLLDQWRFVEAPPRVKQVGAVIIDYIDADGYLRTPYDRIQLETRDPIRVEELEVRCTTSSVSTRRAWGPAICRSVCSFSSKTSSWTTNWPKGTTSIWRSRSSAIT